MPRVRWPCAQTPRLADCLPVETPQAEAMPIKLEPQHQETQTLVKVLVKRFSHSGGLAHEDRRGVILCARGLRRSASGGVDRALPRANWATLISSWPIVKIRQGISDRRAPPVAIFPVKVSPLYV